MDSLTHIVMGATIGEATLGKKVGNKALLWGAFISTIPDLDVLITPFLKPVDGLFFHRGISHSLLFTIILIPILSWLLLKIEKKRDADFKDWAILSGVALLSHIIVDCFNTYGTGIFEPFSNIRIAYDSMAIIDMPLILVLLVLLIPIVLLKKQRKTRRSLAWIGIIFLIGYFIFTVFNKTKVESIVKEQLAVQKIKYNRILTTPIPLTNFMWMAIAEDDNGYNIGYYCNFDSKNDIAFRHLPRNSKYLDKLKSNKDIIDLIRFTKGYYSVDSISKEEIRVYDLRYGSLDYEDKNAYVFTFVINETPTGIEISRAHPDRKINYTTARKYLKRVFNL